MPHRETDTKNIHVRELVSSFIKYAESFGFSRASLLAAFRELGEIDPASAAFTVSVNYEDPRWAEIQRDSYTYVNPDLKYSHFPIGGHGAMEVAMEYVTFDHEPTTQEALDEIKRRGLRRPDRAEAESFLDQHPEEQKKFPVIGLCGSVVDRRGRRNVACVNACEGERNLYFYWLLNRWYQFCRFLAVRK